MGVAPPLRLAAIEQSIHCREREPWIDGFGPVADQCSEMVDVEGVSCLGDEPHPRPEPPLDQMLPDRADREQHRNGRARGRDGAVTDHQDVGPPANGALRRAAQTHQRRSKPLRTEARIPIRIDRDRRKSSDVVQRRHLVRE